MDITKKIKEIRRPKQIKRNWGLAARSEHVRNKEKRK